LLVDVPVFAIAGMRYAADIPRAVDWTLAFTFGAAYSIVPPVLHWRRGRVGIGWASLGIRDGLAGTGYIAGVLLSDCPDRADGSVNWSCINHNAYVGNAIGAVLASAIDVAFLAWDPPASSRPSALDWTPTLSIVPRGATLGVAAAF
jgi:hypothetical protein